MNDKIRQELEEISPDLAKLKQHFKQLDLPVGYKNELFQKVKSDNALSKENSDQQSKAKIINLSILGAVAASCLVLIAYLGLVKHSPGTENQKDVYESYVLDNLDEYEDIMVIENDINSKLANKLVDIPETELISYLENNLDQLDLDLYY